MARRPRIKKSLVKSGPKTSQLKKSKPKKIKLKTASLKKVKTRKSNPLKKGVFEIPPHLQAVESPINAQHIRQKLTDIFNQYPESSKNRPHVLSLLKETLHSAMMDTEVQFMNGRLDGLETARLIAAIHDDIITALYDFVVTHVYRASNPTKAERLSLCAVGGFGRGEMAPQSDVDLLFILADKKGSAFTENVTEYILYMLWDMGLKVGHATRTIEQCISLAKDDQTILTKISQRHYQGQRPALHLNQITRKR